MDHGSTRIARLRHLTLPVLAALALTGPAHAQSGAVEGAGSQPCSALIAAGKENQQLYVAYGSWLSGFMSASNAYESETFDLTPWQSPDVSLAQVAKFCEANPQSRVVEAAVAYVAFLKPDRLTEPNDLVEARNGDKVTFVYASVLSDVRGKLQERGLLETGGTGYDNSLVAALEAYQAEIGIEATGIPDPRTLVALLQ